MHNRPGDPVGKFSIRPGPMMAAADRISITVKGRGAHAARPHVGIDPIVAASHIVVALQSVVARDIDPLAAAVVTIGSIQGGKAGNVIPDSVYMLGTARTFSPAVQDVIEERVIAIVENTAKALGADVEVNYLRDYPVTINAIDETAFAARIAAEISGVDSVDADVSPTMGAEDFSYMLNERPGALIWIGNGETGAGLHHPAYDFNDEIIPVGISYWARIVEEAMPAGASPT